MSIHSVQMVMSGIKQLQRATITQRPANTCFLLKQKQPDQPLCIWVVTAGSSLRLLPQTGTGRNATSFPLLSFSPYTNTHTHTVSSLLCPLTRELLRQCSSHLKQQDHSPLPYLWIKFNWNITEPKTGDLHTQTLQQEAGCAAHATATPTGTSSPILSLVNEFLPRGAFIMRSSQQSPLFDMTHDNLWKC